MAVDKSFVVKNGLEVNSDLIVADASSKKVGIASTAPRSSLDVRGGIAATDLNITGVATIATLEAAAGDVNLGNLSVTGFSTLGGVSVNQLTVTGFTTFADISYDEISGRNLTLTGIATVPTFVGLTSFNDGVEVTGISTFAEIDTTNLNVSGVSTIATVDINAGDIEVSNVDTTDLNVTGVGTIANARITNLNATGVSTIASLSVTGSTFDSLTVNNFSNLSGITTIDDPILAKATVSGVVTAAQFIGAGQIGIGTSLGLVGYGVSFLDFRGPGFTTAQFNSAVGIVTLNFQGGGGSGGGGSASIGVGSTPGDAFTGIITAGNLWYNTGLGRLFIYYQDDDSAQWVDAAPFNVGIITQLTSVGFSTASVAAPSLSFGTDQNTGFFAPADGSVSFGSNGVGIVTFNSTGVLATTYFGDGSNLTGIDVTSLKDDGGNIKAQANPNGVVITGILTGSTANYTGVVTATSFTGDLTGNADTATTATNAQGLSGSPDITVTNVTGAAATFTGNVTIGGTLTYQDVENIDSVGIITAQQGIQVLANGLDVTGFSTFKTGVSVTGVITATSFSGNSSTATTLQTARTINGISFNGSADIVVNPTSGAFSNGQGAKVVQSGGSASGGSSGDIYYIY